MEKQQQQKAHQSVCQNELVFVTKKPQSPQNNWEQGGQDSCQNKGQHQIQEQLTENELNTKIISDHFQPTFTGVQKETRIDQEDDNNEVKVDINTKLNVQHPEIEEEVSTSAQIPYPSREKHFKPCCELSFTQLSDDCKYFKFLCSREKEEEMQALKYYETNLRGQTPDQVSKLISHGLIDALLDKLNKHKIDDRTRLSLKIIFQLCKFKSSQFIFHGRNVLMEKLILSDFPDYINNYSNLLDKRCCLLGQLKEIKIAFASYHYQQKNQEEKNNTCFNGQSEESSSSPCTVFCRNHNRQQVSNANQQQQGQLSIQNSSNQSQQQQQLLQSNQQQETSQTSNIQVPPKACFFKNFFS